MGFVGGRSTPDTTTDKHRWINAETHTWVSITTMPQAGVLSLPAEISKMIVGLLSPPTHGAVSLYLWQRAWYAQWEGKHYAVRDHYRAVFARAAVDLLSLTVTCSTMKAIIQRDAEAKVDVTIILDREEDYDAAAMARDRLPWYCGLWAVSLTIKIKLQWRADELFFSLLSEVWEDDKLESISFELEVWNTDVLSRKDAQNCIKLVRETWEFFTESPCPKSHYGSPCVKGRFDFVTMDYEIHGDIDAAYQAEKSGMPYLTRRFIYYPDGGRVAISRAHGPPLGTPRHRARNDMRMQIDALMNG